MNDDQQLLKETQYPTSKYDYDGITGVWLLIPPKFHLLILAILLPLILWVFPYINFKGNFRYIFADYRYYLAGGISLFFIASALLSIIKAKQVGGKVRPTSNVGAQVVPKKGRATKKTPLRQSTRQSTSKAGESNIKQTAGSKLTVKKSKVTTVKEKITQPSRAKNLSKESDSTGKKRRVTLNKTNSNHSPKQNSPKKEKSTTAKGNNSDK